MHFVGDQPPLLTALVRNLGVWLVEDLETKVPSEQGTVLPEIPSIVAWLGLGVKYFTKETECHVRKLQRTLAVQ